MARFIVRKPWYGVEKGEQVEMDTVHPSLRPHLELIPEQAKLTPSVPEESEETASTPAAKRAEAKKKPEGQK